MSNISQSENFAVLDANEDKNIFHGEDDNSRHDGLVMPSLVNDRSRHYYTEHGCSQAEAAAFNHTHLKISEYHSAAQDGVDIYSHTAPLADDSMFQSFQCIM